MLSGRGKLALRLFTVLEDGCDFLGWSNIPARRPVDIFWIEIEEVTQPNALLP